MKDLNKFRKTYLLLIWTLLLPLCSNTVYADDVDTLSSQFDIIRNQDRQIYYPGNGMVLNYMLPGLLQEILVKTTPYLILHSPLGDPLAIPLSKETDRLHPFVQIDDASVLPAGDYYFSVVLTVPGGDPLKLDDWYLGPYGRISYERLRISATATDSEDQNHDGQFDGDFIDTNGFADPPLTAQLNEDLIRFNHQVFYTDTPMDLSYVLPNRLDEVFAGRANAHLAIQIPGQTDLLYLPLAALNPDGVAHILQQYSITSLPEGDYLLSVVFTRPGGNPANVRDWYPDIAPLNARKRIAVNHAGYDERDFDGNGLFDTDSNGDGSDDAAVLEQRISGLCPGSDNAACRYDKLPLFIARSAEIGDLFDALCKNDKVCADSLQDSLIQDAFSTGNSAAAVVCPTADAACLQQTAFLLYQAKHNTRQRNAVFQQICTGLGNPELCRNTGDADGWAVLYEHIRNITALLRMPLFKKICPDGLKCGANGGFGNLVQNEIEYWQIIDKLCANDSDGTCIDSLFNAIDQIWEAALGQDFPVDNYDQAFDAFYEQNLTTAFCTAASATTCPVLVGNLVRNDGQYAQLLDGICNNNDACAGLVADTAWYMAILADVKNAASTFCQGDTACLTAKVPQILALASLPLDDPAIYDTAYEFCLDDTACDERFYTLLFSEYNLTSVLDESLLN